MKRALGLFIGVLTISLVAHFPASYLYPFVAPMLPKGTQVTQLNGTLWRGNAQLRVDRFEVGPVTWRFAVPRLIRLETGWQITLPQLGANALIAAKPWQLPRLSSVELTADSQPIQRQFPVLAGVATQLDMQLQNLTAGNCEATQGEVILARTQVFELPFGTVSGDINCQGNRYYVEFRNANAPISLTGSATLSAQGAYQLDAQLKTQDATLQQQLVTLFGGRADQQTFVIKQQGRM